MDNTKNEHYIPRFYLKKFSTIRNKKSYLIDVYNKKENKIMLKQNVKNFACINKFYDINIEDIEKQLDIYFKLPNIDETTKKRILSDNQIIEHYLANLESDIAPLFDSIEKNHDIINDIFFRIKFCIFIRDLSIRTKGFRNQLKKIASITLEQMKKLNINNLGSYDINKSADELAKKEQLQGMISLPSTIKEVSFFLKEYDFYIGINNTKIPFVLSDQPALFAFLNVNEICIPISSKIAIIMRAKGENAIYFTDIVPDSYEINLSEKNVTCYNIIQFVSTNEYVFGDIREIRRLSQILKLLEKINNKNYNVF